MHWAFWVLVPPPAILLPGADNQRCRGLLGSALVKPSTPWLGQQEGNNKKRNSFHAHFPVKKCSPTLRCSRWALTNWANGKRLRTIIREALTSAARSPSSRMWTWPSGRPQRWPSGQLSTASRTTRRFSSGAVLLGPTTAHGPLPLSNLGVRKWGHRHRILWLIDKSGVASRSPRSNILPDDRGEILPIFQRCECGC